MLPTGLPAFIERPVDPAGKSKKGLVDEAQEKRTPRGSDQGSAGVGAVGVPFGQFPLDDGTA